MPPPAPALPAPPAADSVEVSLSLDAGSHAVGEPIRMRMVARNVADRALELTFPTAQRADFVVKSQGREVWRWSADMMFAQTVGVETLAAGDSLVFACEWNQALGNGTNAPLGAYTVHGVLKTAPERTTGEKRFGIVD